VLTNILDALDTELAAGRSVYVHCRAGIGRTGMVIACHLIRHGRTNEAALAQLQKLWQQCARSRNWPAVPETPEQVAFVREWREVKGSELANSGSVFEAAVLGMAIGDALGSTVASDRASLQPGASTAVMQLAAESLLERSGHDPNDQMQRYLQWLHATDVVVPPELKRVLATYQWSKKPNAGSHDPKNLDAHTLPRTLAAALFEHADAAYAIELGVELSRTTQQSPVVLDACRIWTALFSDALAGLSKPQLLAASGPALQLVRARELKPSLRVLIEQRWRVANAAADAVAITGSVMTAFANSRTFADGMRLILNAREIPGIAGAMYGGLAGAHYGLNALPAEWRRALTDDATLRALARRFAE
jgi:ADP-ribosyl-[dinitrogen reductase] hydrolase